MWRIKAQGVGNVGNTLSYVAKAKSSGGPPLTAASWQCANGPAPGYPNGFHGAACPGPSLARSGPPDPPAQMYPVPTTPSDMAWVRGLVRKILNPRVPVGPAVPRGPQGAFRENSEYFGRIIQTGRFWMIHIFESARETVPVHFCCVKICVR